jgi:pimeloyl-ACP methyl ester carboxylesterase
MQVLRGKELGMPDTTPNTVLSIHGLWMTPRSWENWKERYEGRGYTVLAPAWPGIVWLIATYAIVFVVFLLMLGFRLRSYRAPTTPGTTSP